MSFASCASFVYSCSGILHTIPLKSAAASKSATCILPDQSPATAMASRNVKGKLVTIIGAGTQGRRLALMVRTDRIYDSRHPQLSPFAASQSLEVKHDAECLCRK